MTKLDKGANKLAAMASECGPLSYLERSFVLAASVRAPPDPSSVERTEWGYLVFRWDAPSPDVGSLWATICPEEVVLSTRISHNHFSRTRYLPEKPAGRKLKLKIARDSAQEAARVLSGEVCVTIDYYAEGQRHSYGWVSKDQLAESLAYSRQVFGEGITMRAWNWFGEVSV